MEEQSRAAKGGEFGVNGEWYDGGEFLPSTARGKMTKAQAKKAANEAYRQQLMQVTSRIKQALSEIYAGDPRLANLHPDYHSQVMNELYIKDNGLWMKGYNSYICIAEHMGIEWPKR